MLYMLLIFAPNSVSIILKAEEATSCDGSSRQLDADRPPLREDAVRLQRALQKMSVLSNFR